MGEAGIRNSDLRRKSVQLKIRKKQGPCTMQVSEFSKIVLILKTLANC